MNVDTNELRRFTNEDERKELIKSGFTEVPEELEAEAFKELNERNRVFVNMRKKTPLIVWARDIKQGRNELCACGSGKKHKKCCLGKGES